MVGEAGVKARQGTWSGICLRGLPIPSTVKQAEVASGSDLGIYRTDARLCRQKNQEKERAQGIRESADKAPTSRGTGARHWAEEFRIEVSLRNYRVLPSILISACYQDSERAVLALFCGKVGDLSSSRRC